MAVQNHEDKVIAVVTAGRFSAAVGFFIAAGRLTISCAAEHL